MSYLNEFHKRIEAKDFMSFLQLWEEYCTCDEVDGIELKKILDLIFESEFCVAFGSYAESILPLWKSIESSPIADEIFSRILDIQTTNSPVLAELAYEFLKSRHSKDQHFNEKIRLIGLRNKNQFRHAIANYNLLCHLETGNFVYHTAGWGTGEILSLSLIREELSIEFENVLGKKQISFENAFKTLKPLDKQHFFAQRFGNPDALEKLAKQDPVGIVRKILEELGPKTAAEIKEEISELVIPKNEWTSWWQLVRNKLKKEAGIEIPASLSQPFRIREQDVSPAQRFAHNLLKAKSNDERIITCYNFVRDFSECLRDPQNMELLESTLQDLKKDQALNSGQHFEVLCLGLETRAKSSYEKELVSLVEKLEQPQQLLDQIPIIALQKKLFICLAAQKSHWPALFAELLPVIDQSLLRDYLFKELLLQARAVLDKQLENILAHPKQHAEFLMWLLSKVTSDLQLPYSEKRFVCNIAEAFLTALHHIETQSNQASLAKKMCNFLTAKRFSFTRQIMEGGDPDFLQEFLLLASKCQCFSQQDNKILASLAMVACPELKNVLSAEDGHIAQRVIWTTEEGLAKIRSKLENLATHEMVDVAKEIETARSHGDLKENSEYKYALERRSRIQSEIKNLSRQLENARVIPKHELDTSKVSIGTKIKLSTQEGKDLHYTILGPWEADTENGIISFQSKIACSLLDKKVGEKLNLMGINCTIEAIDSAL